VAQLGDAPFVEQHRGQRRQQVTVLVAVSGDRDADRDGVATPVHATRELQHGHGRPPHVLASNGAAVRDRRALADEGRHRVLALVHRRDVRLIDGADPDQHRAALVDRVGLVPRGQAQSHRVRGQHAVVSQQEEPRF